MEELCKSLRNFSMHKVCFKSVFPERDPETAILSMEEAQLLIAHLSAFASVYAKGTDLIGYREVIRSMQENARNDKLCHEISKLTAAITSNGIQTDSSAQPTADNSSAERAVQSEAELFKNVPLRTIVQNKPTSKDTNEDALAKYYNEHREEILKMTGGGVNLDGIEYRTAGCAQKWSYAFLAYLIKNKQFDLLSIAKKSKPTRRLYCIITWRYLMGDGDLDMLIWLIKDGCSLSPRLLYGEATKHGHMNILQYLADTYGMVDAAPGIRIAICSGQLEVLKWAVLNGYTSDQIMVWAHENNRQNIIDWMKSAGFA